MLIDTHAHLYLDRFAEDREAVMERARDAGVGAVVLPAIDVPSIHDALALCDRYEHVYAMAALHPSAVREATETDLEAVAVLCDDPRIVAVGESGLDYYWDRSYDAKQQAYFRHHIQLAIAKDLPLILHIRDKRDRDEVHRDIVRILREEKAKAAAPDRLRGIFHCFTGPAWFAEAAHELGFFLGLGGVLTFKNSGLDAIVAEVPLDQLVLETDAPYLAPEPHRGQRNESAYVRFVAETLAQVKGLTVDEVVRATTRNAEQVFGISVDAD